MGKAVVTGMGVAPLEAGAKQGVLAESMSNSRRSRTQALRAAGKRSGRRTWSTFHSQRRRRTWRSIPRVAGLVKVAAAAPWESRSTRARTRAYCSSRSLLGRCHLHIERTRFLGRRPVHIGAQTQDWRDRRGAGRGFELRRGYITIAVVHVRASRTFVVLRGIARATIGAIGAEKARGKLGTRATVAAMSV